MKREVFKMKFVPLSEKTENGFVRMCGQTLDIYQFSWQHRNFNCRSFLKFYVINIKGSETETKKENIFLRDHFPGHYAEGT